ncbi:hypothetical protein ACOJBO_10730 [Rhizobium beringeri]
MRNTLLLLLAGGLLLYWVTYSDWFITLMKPPKEGTQATDFSPMLKGMFSLAGIAGHRRRRPRARQCVPLGLDDHHRQCRQVCQCLITRRGRSDPEISAAFFLVRQPARRTCSGDCR